MTSTPPTIPPSDARAEMCLLAEMVFHRNVIDDVLRIIPADRADWFYDTERAELYTIIVEMHGRNETIDGVTLNNELRRRNWRSDYERIDAVLRTMEAHYNVGNAIRYANIVRGFGMMRDLIGCVDKVRECAMSPSEDFDAVLDWAEGEVIKVTERRVEAEGVTLVQASEQDAEAFRSGGQIELNGIRSGYYRLDELTGGFHPGELVILAARPSVGKTSVAANMILAIAKQENIPIGVFTFEVMARELARKMICMSARIDHQKARRRLLSLDERNAFAEHREMLANCAPIYIHEGRAMTTGDIAANTRIMRRKQDIGIVFIDYLQLIETRGRSESRQIEVAKQSKALKSMALRENLAVVCMAQLNRLVEGRKESRPRMSDLRESGAIEQDADVVLLIHREDYHLKPEIKAARAVMQNPTASEDSKKNAQVMLDKEGKAVLILDKQRNGPTGDVDLLFDYLTANFDNPANPADEARAIADNVRRQAQEVF